MNLSFKAKIYKVGINLCVKVPFRITKRMNPTKGYIPVRGTIDGFKFQQTLVPVKNEEYRLYVNGIMLKGSETANGNTVRFDIEEDPAPRTVETYPMPKLLKKKLNEHGLMHSFNQQTPSRQKEILRYLNNLKSDEALIRNIDRVIGGIKKGNNPYRK